jgi:hypothetical protein
VKEEGTRDKAQGTEEQGTRCGVRNEEEAFLETYKLVAYSFLLEP